jgi:hypothetical protein
MLSEGQGARQYLGTPEDMNKGVLLILLQHAIPYKIQIIVRTLEREENTPGSNLTPQKKTAYLLLPKIPQHICIFLSSFDVA